MVHQILCVGQSDSGGVAGLQADLKTIHAFGGYALSVVTAVSAKNTQGYEAVRMMDEYLVRAQFEAVLKDFQPEVLKTGMIGSAPMINLVSEYAEKLSKKGVKIIVDPVMKSTTGRVMLDKEARDALKRSLILVADVLVATVHETEELTGMKIRDIDEMRHAAEMLVTLGPKAVVVRGGDLSAVDSSVVDIVASEESLDVCQSDRFSKKDVDGLGATMASAMALSLAEGMSLMESYDRACVYVNKAVMTAKGLGAGRGPLNHCLSASFCAEQDV